GDRGPRAAPREFRRGDAPRARGVGDPAGPAGALSVGHREGHGSIRPRRRPPVRGQRRPGRLSQQSDPAGLARRARDPRPPRQPYREGRGRVRPLRVRPAARQPPVLTVSSDPLIVPGPPVLTDQRAVARVRANLNLSSQPGCPLQPDGGRRGGEAAVVSEGLVPVDGLTAQGSPREGIRLTRPKTLDAAYVFRLGRSFSRGSNPKVVGSNPTPARNQRTLRAMFFGIRRLRVLVASALKVTCH